MQRFNSGDHILILPRFANLYPSNSGVIVDGSLNAFRAMFNAYTVKFPDGSTDVLFEFQILENSTEYQNVVAALVFDSSGQPGGTQLRGPTDRHIVLQTAAIDIDMRINVSKTHATVVGQVLERDAAHLLPGAEVTVMQDSNPICITKTDRLGTFEFLSVPVGPLNLLVLVRAKSLRILGALSIDQ